jgi:hypothetical protein
MGGTWKPQKFFLNLYTSRVRLSSHDMVTLAADDM